jgi:hypothetical protein
MGNALGGTPPSSLWDASSSSPWQSQETSCSYALDSHCMVE